MAINDFGGRPPSWILKICSFCHVAFVGMPFCFFTQNFAEIGKSSMSYGHKTIFKMAATAILNFKNFNFLVTWLQSGSIFAVVYQISSKSDNFSLRYSDQRISKWRPSAILDFKNLHFLSSSPCQHAVLLPHIKFRKNPTIGRWVMAKKAIFKMAVQMAVVAILNFKKINFWLRACNRVQHLL